MKGHKGVLAAQVGREYCGSVEQSIGQNVPPVHAAGTDPAFVPGLTFQPPAVANAAVAEQPTEEPTQPPPEAAVEEVEEEETAAAEAAESAAEPPPDGPVFEVSDHRGSIVADHTGINYRLDGERAEFPWDEVGAVEIDNPRFGRRFAVVVHTIDGRRYDHHVDAAARNLLAEWTTGLDAVLDAYFEESAS